MAFRPMLLSKAEVIQLPIPRWSANWIHSFNREQFHHGAKVSRMIYCGRMTYLSRASFILIHIHTYQLLIQGDQGARSISTELSHLWPLMLLDRLFEMKWISYLAKASSWLMAFSGRNPPLTCRLSGSTCSWVSTSRIRLIVSSSLKISMAPDLQFHTMETQPGAFPPVVHISS